MQDSTEFDVRVSDSRFLRSYRVWGRNIRRADDGSIVLLDAVRTWDGSNRKETVTVSSTERIVSIRPR